MVKKINLFIYSFFILLLSSFCFAGVEVFSQYDTEITVNSNNTLDVHKSIYLQNIHTVGIVPGSVEFKINKRINNSNSEIKVSNIRIYDRYDNNIKFKVHETEEFVIIAIDIFSPLLPGFEYKMDLFYTLEYDSQGLLFKSLEVPLKESNTIPIQSGSYKINLPENYGFTYISYKDNVSQMGKNTAEWKFDSNMPKSLIFEYSVIPLGYDKLKGSVVFWLIIDSILFMILVIEVIRRIRKSRKEEE